MKENVFFASDASFKEDRTAILAVRDMYTGKMRQKQINIKIKSSLIAEELALRYAIEIAMNQEYKHVIFIYDSLAINVNKFKKRYSKYFETMQFLWLKRKHIADVDRVTKFKEDQRLISMRDIPEEKRDEIVIEILSKYVQTAKEAQLFSRFNNKEYKVSKENRTILFTLLYFLLSKSGKKKVKRVLKDELSSLELKKTFSRKHSKEYLGFLKQLGIKDDFIKDMIHLKRNS